MIQQNISPKQVQTRIAMIRTCAIFSILGFVFVGTSTTTLVAGWKSRIIEKSIVKPVQKAIAEFNAGLNLVPTPAATPIATPSGDLFAQFEQKPIPVPKRQSPANPPPQPVYRYVPVATPTPNRWYEDARKKQEAWWQQSLAEHEKFRQQGQQSMQEFDARAKADMEAFKQQSQQQTEEFKKKYGF